MAELLEFGVFFRFREASCLAIAAAMTPDRDTTETFKSDGCQHDFFPSSPFSSSWLAIPGIPKVTKAT